MLYPEKNKKVLDKELFDRPTAEYRAAPFWSWNCELDKDELLRQIDCLHDMGFGGFHMHSRAGMATPYLSPEFMDLVRACADHAEEKNMLAWLYDEDRWPSGAAGGIVTKNRRYRQHRLLFSEKKLETVSFAEACETAGKTLLCAYDILLGADGTLASYRRVPEDSAPADGCRRRYLYMIPQEPSGWHNGQTYVDMMMPEAVREFMHVTYDKYADAVGERFGKTVPAIFTDEPMVCTRNLLSTPTGTEDLLFPYTPDFPETYRAAYGADFFESFPELVWNLPKGGISLARYRFYDHFCERFVSAFVDQCGARCEQLGLALTGHVMAEDTLSSQAEAVGETMRCYRSFTIPGIDTLCDALLLNTAKQAQSAKHQYNREAMMSELYGVTGWGFDFRGHKFQGDWEAALGVTVRVPHLSWVSMRGSAKRDFPASISYQSAWYKDYSYVEDHFARLNTVLTRGKPLISVGVIHPIESMWLHTGPHTSDTPLRNELDRNFADLTEWLLTSFNDFDFIAESEIPALHRETEQGFAVGAMTYDTLIVPGCETLRRTTLDALRRFRDRGGRLIFLGECPRAVDAVASDEVRALYERSEVLPFRRTAVTQALQDHAPFTVLRPNGTPADDLISAYRQDGDRRWLFLANIRRRLAKSMNYRPLIIRLRGNFTPVLYDTVQGEIRRIGYKRTAGETVIEVGIYATDSLLLCLLEKGAEGYDPSDIYAPAEKQASSGGIRLSAPRMAVAKRHEPNVYPLDLARYALNDAPLSEDSEEILRIDVACRKILGYPMADGSQEQPWVLPDHSDGHTVLLCYEVNCAAPLDGLHIAHEGAVSLSVNGEEGTAPSDGYFADRAIATYPIPALRAGQNRIEMRVPITQRRSVEAAYLLGDFDVTLRGVNATLCPPDRTVGFGPLPMQGMPFYGANLDYTVEIDLPQAGDLQISVPVYRGAAVRVALDGKPLGLIAYAPFSVTADGAKAGKHTLTLTLLCTRENTFGAIHTYGDLNGDLNWVPVNWFPDGAVWYGPTYYYPKNEHFAKEYRLHDTGILTAPQLTLFPR